MDVKKIIYRETPVYLSPLQASLKCTECIKLITSSRFKGQVVEFKCHVQTIAASDTSLLHRRVLYGAVGVIVRIPSHLLSLRYTDEKIHE